MEAIPHNQILDLVVKTQFIWDVWGWEGCWPFCYILPFPSKGQEGGRVSVVVQEYFWGALRMENVFKGRQNTKLLSKMTYLGHFLLLMEGAKFPMPLWFLVTLLEGSVERMLTLAFLLVRQIMEKDIFHIKSKWHICWVWTFQEFLYNFVY